MDLSTFPPIAVVLDGLYTLVAGLGDALAPIVGASSTALAIVALTLAVRLLLVPASVATVRAEIGRRRLAPAIARLRAKHAGKPEHLQKALTQLYTSEKVSPLAGCLPTLAQAPVLSAVYTLFAHGSIAGHANLLLAQTFVGLPLGANLFVIVGAALPQVWVALLLLAVLACFVELTRRANLRWNGAVSVSTPAPGSMSGARVSAATAGAGTSAAMRLLPFVSVVFAAIAPLAALLYLMTSAAWTLGERALLRRLLA